jgi:hypothetical protein
MYAHGPNGIQQQNERTWVALYGDSRRFDKNFDGTYLITSVTVAERSKACTVFARSEAGTVGSNLTQGMDV